MFIKKHKKGFTIVELIVVMAVIGILVLLAIPKFMGHTKEAKFTKLIANTKVLEDASERYYIDKGEWPRIGDEYYSAEDIEVFAKKIFDITGKEINLDPNGKYYDIDYDVLSKYIQIPDDKEYYILQNPVGNVYALDGLSEAAKKRLMKEQATSIEFKETKVTIGIGESKTIKAVLKPIKSIQEKIVWESSNTAVATVDENGKITAINGGTAKIKAYTEDKRIFAEIEIVVPIPFTTQTLSYTGNYQTIVIPKTGTYKLEVWGASGGSSLGGKGGYAYGEKNFNIGDVLYIYVGGQGKAKNGGWNGGGSTKASHGYGGGGATDIRTISGNWNDLTSLQSRIIVAGAGGGVDDGLGGIKGGAGGGLTGGNGGEYTSYMGNGYGGTGGTQTSGGASKDGYNKGSLGTGGNGSNSDAGGGGGGYYGGGGATGYNCAGGGGSSYIDGLSNAGTTAGVNTGNGKAVITYIEQ